MALPEGFLWKPYSDSNGNLVILTPSEWNDKIDSVQVGDEVGNFSDIANGNRSHWRFSRPGDAYGSSNEVVVRFKDGSTQKLPIESTNMRWEASGASSPNRGLGGMNPADFLSMLLGPQNITTTQTYALPEYLKPYVPDYLQLLQDTIAPGGQLTPYPFMGNRVAAWDPLYVAGQNAAVGRAVEDQYLVGNLWNQANRTLTGEFLDPNSNPWLQATFDQAARGVTDQYRYATAPQNDALFNKALSFGGSAHKQMTDMNQYGLGQTLNDLAAKIFGGNYEAERQRQYGQQAMIPNVINSAFIGPQMLQNVGLQRQTLAQGLLDAQTGNYNQAAQWPFTALNMLGSGLGPFAGSLNSSTSSPNPNRSSALGTLLSLQGGGGGAAGGGKFPNGMDPWAWILGGL